MSTSTRPAAMVYGALAANLTAPQVDAAIRVLVQACQPLAAFRDHRCVGSGAYLDPRMLAGEVVLAYLREDAAAPASRAARARERAVGERVLIRWADLFQAASWEVLRYRETDQYDGYRLVRLVLTPPAEAVPGRRVLTPIEHHAAWHAIESAASEEGADPGTVLNAVLRALNIDAPPGQ
ncbi:hypothetical protein [Streptomyces subrutilus]|uniref:Uncharacterized protein n=1 Tax=Streptomyces subrutilus TaxID=36818 RepID=A0A1E5NXP9_9ACTN|nr:hypothetical protein [Streptomyces subrutilus]OEJ21032.1 hypothetical protein BGK67_34615 [Streptomyces subrutilus]